MSIKRFLLSLAFPLLFATLSGCELFDEVTKSDFDKQLEYITKVWKVDSVRVREYGYIQSSGALPQTPLASSKLLPITKMEFLRNDGAFAGTVLQTSIGNGKEVMTELEWRYDEEYLNLYYPNPALGGLSPQATIFDMVEISDKKFVFKREENLIDDRSGVRYGSLERYYYLSK